MGDIADYHVEQFESGRWGLPFGEHDESFLRHRRRTCGGYSGGCEFCPDPMEIIDEFNWSLDRMEEWALESQRERFERLADMARDTPGGIGEIAEALELRSENTANVLFLRARHRLRELLG